MTGISDRPANAGRTKDESFRWLDAVEIDNQREFIEFRFVDTAGQAQSIQIDFAYVESLAGLFQQALLSAVLTAEQGGNRPLGREWLAVPRADIDHRINVGVDVMSGRIVTMFLLGSPFQVSYALPASNARALAADLLAACDAAAQQEKERNAPPN